MSTFPDTGYTNGLKVRPYFKGFHIALMSPDRRSIRTVVAQDEERLPTAIRVLNEKAALDGTPPVTIEQVRALV